MCLVGAHAKPSLFAFPSYYEQLASASAPSHNYVHSVKSQFHAQDELGQYAYGYNDGLSSKVESKTADGITQGSYAYVDSNGILQNVNYISDDVNGFRVSASNLPSGPGYQYPLAHDHLHTTAVIAHQPPTQVSLRHILQWRNQEGGGYRAKAPPPDRSKPQKNCGTKALESKKKIKNT